MSESLNVLLESAGTIPGNLPGLPLRLSGRRPPPFSWTSLLAPGCDLGEAIERPVGLVVRVVVEGAEMDELPPLLFGESVPGEVGLV